MGADVLGDGHVFYIGPPKSGSSSFHALMHQLGVNSFHVGGPGLLDGLPTTKAKPSLATLYAADKAACARTKRTALGPLPEREIQRAIGQEAVSCMLTATGYRAFSDDPWPLLYKTVDELQLPRTRFIMWERDPDEWATSFVRFFSNSAGRAEPWLRLAYGVCTIDNSSLPLLSETMRRHILGVRAYFAGDKRRRERLLLLRDLHTPGLADRICNFVLGRPGRNVSSGGSGGDGGVSGGNASALHGLQRCARLHGGTGSEFLSSSSNAPAADTSGAAAVPHVRPARREAGGAPAFKDRYNVPLGTPAEIPSWRECVLRARAPTRRAPTRSGQHNDVRYSDVPRIA
jgi:hypothetical protein